jgi:hypothetical protein
MKKVHKEKRFNRRKRICYKELLQKYNLLNETGIAED